MKQKLYITAALILGIIVVINLLSNEFHVRIDLTRDHQYTLSKATESIIGDLEEPVTIKAYYSEGLPPYVMKAKKDFHELLIEYSNASDGKVMYEFINPSEDEKYETEAINYGIRPILIDMREKDQVKQQKAFLGAVVLLGDKQESIGILQPGAAMEYGLTTAIRKIALSDKPSIGFLQGHGEPSLQELIEANEQLEIQYKTEPVYLSDSLPIDSEIRTLAVVRPQDSIPGIHLERLDEFVARGGRLLVAINTVDGDLRSRYGYPVTTGLENWLLKSGVLVDLSFVIDASCGSVMVPQQLGPYTLETKVSFPFIPIIKTFNDHPVTTGLEALMFQFASTIQFIGDSNIHFTPLALSSDRSNALRAPQQFDIQREWTKADFPRQKLIVAAALERTDTKAKMIVVSDGDFIVNGPPQQARRLQADNLSFFSNSIDWLSDETGLVSLRTKGATSYPIKELDDNIKTIIKYVNFSLPLVLVVGYGVFRSQRNRIRRFKQMSENYDKAQ
jgi:gliding-associated putative ABC transporter substrate-binding component GldG